jgi:hypothetical protein
LKLTTRLLLTLPFVVVSYLYLKLNLADDGCWGLIEGMYTIGLFILFAVTIPLAIMGTLRKRQLNKGKPEPITLSIGLVTLFTLIVGKAFGENLKGSTWIYALSDNRNLHTQSLTLRTNGTFRVDLNEVDFSCYFSGNYQKHGDTILLDKGVIEQTNSLLTTKYLLKDTVLMPLNDTTKNSIRFSELVISAKR